MSQAALITGNSKSMTVVSRNHPTSVYAFTLMNDALSLGTGYTERQMRGATGSFVDGSEGIDVDSVMHVRVGVVAKGTEIDGGLNYLVRSTHAGETTDEEGFALITAVGDAIGNAKMTSVIATYGLVGVAPRYFAVSPTNGQHDVAGMDFLAALVSDKEFKSNKRWATMNVKSVPEGKNISADLRTTLTDLNEVSISLNKKAADLTGLSKGQNTVADIVEAIASRCEWYAYGTRSDDDDFDADPVARLGL